MESERGSKRLPALTTRRLHDLKARISAGGAGDGGARRRARWPRGSPQGRLTQDELLRFEPLGNVTLVHVTDIHAQLVPLHFREPSVNLGVGEAKGMVPHITGKAFLEKLRASRRARRRPTR